MRNSRYYRDIRLSLNNVFLYKIQRQGRLIIKKLNEENLPEELEDAIFIIKMNEFDKDLPEVASLVEKYYEIETEIHLKQKQEAEFLARIDSKELISKTRNFYETAFKYSKHYSLRGLLLRPTINFVIRDTSPFDTRIHHSDKKSNSENIYNAHSFFKEHDFYLKSFLNKLYNDGKDGEKFMQNKFNITSNKYKQLKETNNDIENQKSITDTTKEKEIQNNYIKKIDSIFEKYPPMICNIIIDLSDLLEKSNTLNISASTSVV